MNSQDPNAKIGPSGFGSNGYISDAGIFPYKIDFENSSSATAPAQQVEIADQLNANLDWSTFQLTQIGFGDTNIVIPTGSQSYETSVPMTYYGISFVVGIDAGIHTSTGQVYANFFSLDPTTGLPPNVLAGFLPPEDGTGRGQGYVSYTIAPKSGLANGTQITNVASIVFDGAAPILTDQKDDEDPSQGIDPTKEDLLTIDSVPPTSTVTALSANESSNSFTVAWIGSDPNGSGVASYNIYVSDNGGAFTLWQPNTTATSATFTGTTGHTYGFYSIATDNVGNVQAAKSVADTTTTLGAVAPAVSSYVVDNGTTQRSMVRTLTVTFNTPVNLTSGAITLNKISGGISTPVTFTIASSNGGSTYTLTPTGGTSHGSLIDGNYSVVITAADVMSVATPTTMMAANSTYTFFRLFGDSNGDGTVNLVDYKAFKSAFLTSTGNAAYSFAFDSNADGTINLVDYKAFAANYLKSVPT